ncbi:hypothetical protein CPLU01_09739 [Colletotrichum plurivorum]|uniref:Uncharacterized protein n=1 Tax=Colletotrichum plurivorum TaxID=2175906 RepID=A0A8H6K8E7_9PEZI|nr:hypothetical protein CPLU01_09739 [Colletotrichum plurivorum]
MELHFATHVTRSSSLLVCLSASSRLVAASRQQLARMLAASDANANPCIRSSDGGRRWDEPTTVDQRQFQLYPYLALPTGRTDAGGGPGTQHNELRWSPSSPRLVEWGSFQKADDDFNRLQRPRPALFSRDLQVAPRVLAILELPSACLYSWHYCDWLDPDGAPKLRPGHPSIPEWKRRSSLGDAPSITSSDKGKERCKGLVWRLSLRQSARLRVQYSSTRQGLPLPVPGGWVSSPFMQPLKRCAACRLAMRTIESRATLRVRELRLDLASPDGTRARCLHRDARNGGAARPGIATATAIRTPGMPMWPFAQCAAQDSTCHEPLRRLESSRRLMLEAAASHDRGADASFLTDNCQDFSSSSWLTEMERHRRHQPYLTSHRLHCPVQYRSTASSMSLSHQSRSCSLHYVHCCGSIQAWLQAAMLRFGPVLYCEMNEDIQDSSDPGSF